ncbi:uncharacterized protein LOC144123370 [Amblyomma americanum]
MTAAAAEAQHQPPPPGAAKAAMAVEAGGDAASLAPPAPDGAIVLVVGGMFVLLSCAVVAALFMLAERHTAGIATVTVNETKAPRVDRMATVPEDDEAAPSTVDDGAFEGDTSTADPPESTTNADEAARR